MVTGWHAFRHVEVPAIGVEAEHVHLQHLPKSSTHQVIDGLWRRAAVHSPQLTGWQQAVQS